MSEEHGKQTMQERHLAMAERLKQLIEEKRQRECERIQRLFDDRDELERLRIELPVALTRAEAAEAERDRYCEALVRVAYGDWETASEVERIARAAMGDRES
jgi:hypothetical protein